VPIGGHDEHPPLLPVGHHALTLPELRALCVDRFPYSETRSAIMDGLERVIARIEESGIEGDIWVNGSFLTEKSNPNDSDIVLRLEHSVLEAPTEEQGTVLDWLRSDLKTDHLCDSYMFCVYPEDDARAVHGTWMEAYWIRQFGFNRGDEVKGIAVVRVGAGT